MAVAVLLIVITGNMILTGTASAQSGTTISGIVVGVDTDPDGRLIKFAIADSSGTVTTFGVSEATEYGLENRSTLVAATRTAMQGLLAAGPIK